MRQGPHHVAQKSTIDNPDATSEELLQFVKGPDFPTGGFLVGAGGIRDALTTGRGSVKIRAVCDIQEIRKGRTAIVVTELPYQVSIERVISKIKEALAKQHLVVENKRLYQEALREKIVIKKSRPATWQAPSTHTWVTESVWPGSVVRSIS